MIARLRSFLLAALILCGLVNVQVAGASGAVVAPGKPVFTASFDKGVTGDLKSAPRWERHGGAHIRDGISGGAVRLGKAEYLTLDARRLLHGDEGTIIFWVRPHWREDDRASHTFLSMPWGDGRGGYLVISRGWWEPNGSGLTYFVSNNQDFANVAKEVRFESGAWTQIACSWRAGERGFARLYVNGILVAENNVPAKKGNLPSGRLVLGGDQGTPMGQNRWADSDFDEVALYRDALTAERILDDYEAKKLHPISLQRGKDGTLIETRAIFDEGTGWQTEEGARRTIQRIRRAGFNVYIPCVWHGGGARFPTATIAAEGGRRFGERDPLARLIAIAHEQGIQVHPWFTVALSQGDLLPEFRPHGAPPNAFDIHRPEYRRFIVNLIREVAEKFPIDGINLDFIRTMGVCHCEKCVTEYHKKYGRDLLTDAPLTDRHGVLRVASLQQWQDEAVEEIVRGVSSSVRKARPSAVISVDGHPTPYPSAEGREEIRWANLGLVDLIFDMAYGDVPDIETPHLMRPRLNDPNRLIILINNYSEAGKRMHPKDPAWMMRTAKHVRNRLGNGIGVYLYSMLSDEQVEAFAEGIFKIRTVPATSKSK